MPVSFWHASASDDVNTAAGNDIAARKSAVGRKASQQAIAKTKGTTDRRWNIGAIISQKSEL